MIVPVAVVSKACRHMLSEQGEVTGIAADRIGRAGATQMGVDADHMIGGGHHEVQVVGHQQNPASTANPDRIDGLIELRLAGDVDGLGRLVEDQQVGLTQQSTREQHALELAAGDVGERGIPKVVGTNFVQDRATVVNSSRRRARQEAVDG